MDGTFDQMKPLKRVPFGERPIYSFDLSAATDRLPIWLQSAILESVYSREFAEAWKTLLVGRYYKTPKPGPFDSYKLPKGEYPNEVLYTVGQPMGALSSWAMLAITHHYIVHYCAWTSGVIPKTKSFTEYAVLGDDIVIWNATVAKRYLTVMSQLGVEIGLAKSIISSKGSGLEFAKKTFLNGQDVSPVPFKDMSSAHRNVAIATEFMHRYNMTFLQLLRFLGYGYKVDPTKDNSVVKAIKLALLIPKSARELLSIFKPDRAFIDLAGMNYPIYQVKKQLIELIFLEAQKQYKTSKTLYYDLISFEAGCYSNSVGPWRTRESILKAAIANNYCPRYFSDLKSVMGSSKGILG